MKFGQYWCAYLCPATSQDDNAFPLEVNVVAYLRPKDVNATEQDDTVEGPMSFFSTQELQELINFHSDACVSIYMPTYQIGQEVMQNPIHFKDMIDQAEEQLQQRGLRYADARDLVAPARDLQDRSEFWRIQGRGLAAFLSRGFFRYYRLPSPFNDTLVVNQRFSVKPLIPLTSGDSDFYILALSQNHTRLILANRNSAKEIDLRGMPHSVEEALSLDTYQEQQQYHTDTQNPGGAGPGERAAIWFGHGGSKDVSKENISRFFQQVESVVTDYLDERHSPLILAGVEYLLPLYKQANTYNQIVDNGIVGSPDQLDPKELQMKAQKIMEPFFEKGRITDLSRYADLSRTNLSSTDPKEIIPAAYYGRIDTLFVASKAFLWGRFDPNSGELELSEEKRSDLEDMTDSISVQTLLNNGKVYVLDLGEMPDKVPMAAIFRYALPPVPGVEGKVK